MLFCFLLFHCVFVNAGVDGLQRRLERRHDVEHREPGGLERLGVLVGRACRRRDEADALLDDHVDDLDVLHERDREVHAERLAGHRARLTDVLAHLIDAERARYEADRPGVRDGRDQRWLGDEAHRGLDDGDLHPEHAGDAVVERHDRTVSLTWRRRGTP